MVAAALSRVREAKIRHCSFLYPDQTPAQREQELARRDLESLCSIYGLLRERPDALSRYARDLKKGFMSRK